MLILELDIVACTTRGSNGFSDLLDLQTCIDCAYMLSFFGFIGKPADGDC